MNNHRIDDITRPRNSSGTMLCSSVFDEAISSSAVSHRHQDAGGPPEHPRQAKSISVAPKATTPPAATGLAFQFSAAGQQ